MPIPPPAIAQAPNVQVGMVTVGIHPSFWIVADIAVQVEGLWVTENRVRHRRRPCRPVGTHKASEVGEEVARAEIV